MTERSILIFGAGKIGRSFIGQLFGKQGYEVVFVDTDRLLVDELNNRRHYTVVIKGPEKVERICIENVRAIQVNQRESVTSEIARTGIVAISVGKRAIPAIVPLLAEGLLEREKARPGSPLDVILAENMRSADQFLRKELEEILPPHYPLDRRVGLVETSIGKMVPLMTAQDLEEDPLRVFAEPYNTLILSRHGFRGAIPDIPEFALKDHMKAWVDRKAFIHNLGHATAAYSGYLESPDAVHMCEVLEIGAVRRFTRNVMQESAEILWRSYPEEFTLAELHEHIEELIERFRNRNLGDTVYRVGSDLQRKLGPDDRFLGAVRLAQSAGRPYGKIVEAMAMGFRFRAHDENGTMLPEDELFHRSFSSAPMKVLTEVCGLDPHRDAGLIDTLKRFTGCTQDLE